MNINCYEGAEMEGEILQGVKNTGRHTRQKLKGHRIEMVES
jgi:hypothetical protein